MKLELVSSPPKAAGIVLEGPYSLTVDGIHGAVPEAAVGVFAVGYLDFQNRFRIEAVGRGDQDLRQELRGLIGTSGLFKFRSYVSSKETFLMHCELFHRFTPPGNVVHPSRPAGTDWRCPHCLGSSLRR